MPLDDSGFNPSTAKDIKEVYRQLASVEELFERKESPLLDAMNQSQKALENLTSALSASRAARQRRELVDRLSAACGLGGGKDARTGGKVGAEASSVLAQASARGFATGQSLLKRGKERGGADRLTIDVPSSPVTPSQSCSTPPSSNGVSPIDRALRARRASLPSIAATSPTVTRTLEPRPARTPEGHGGGGGGGWLGGGGGRRRDSPERPTVCAEGPAAGRPRTRTSLSPVARLRAAPADRGDEGARAARGGAPPLARLRAPSASAFRAAAAAAAGGGDVSPYDTAAAGAGDRALTEARGRVPVGGASLGSLDDPRDSLAAPGRRLRPWSSPGRRRPSAAELRWARAGGGGAAEAQCGAGAGALSRRLAAAAEAAAAIGGGG